MGFENLSVNTWFGWRLPHPEYWGLWNRGEYRLIDKVECVFLETGEQILLSNEDCQFGYRDSVFKHALANKVLITHVNFKLPKQYELEVPVMAN